MSEPPDDGPTSRDDAAHATAIVTVHDSRAEPFDEDAGPTLAVLSLRETFAGAMAGESDVRALQVRHADGSATMLSLQRLDGSLDGRRGTFVLQGTETVRDGAIHATWTVVPGSGTDDLVGLRGDGGFEGAFGTGSTGTLDYWFER